ncbi:MAG: hypothetical protein LC102_02300 [Ignavibacteriales bacterium]|jgi:Enterochelin esterase and related enzymes|nr:MAG: histidine kinase [Ignavibacteriaceae bacterium]MBW7872172.1 histidine kinase [Ignavibacteria bacterium]MCZ2142244.1 hypothetical protein [Ignavibacteriales bacterium]MBV6445683.1 hypothetical protein [Ignavibacteriaceae bacterium]MBZ0197345.1 hypothetical protein [Ignavibacteriaceae bacterium]
MRFTSKLFLLFQFFLFTGYSQTQPVKVEIKVNAKNVLNDEAVYITGSLPQLGNWNPGKIKMTETQPGTWSFFFTADRKEPLEFKFTKGSWALEAVDDNGTIPENYFVKVTKDTLLQFNICCWGANEKPKFQGGLTGKAEYLRNVGAGNILPRDIIILLPDDYYTSSERYPVLYMHDGQNIADPATCGFGVDWQIDEALDSLSKSGAVQKMIVVGVYNSVNRNREYSNTKLGEEYMSFLVHYLKPKIDSLYRTKSGRENTWTAGSSMGGLISFMLLWEYNDTFSEAGCFSPALKIEKYDYVSVVKATQKPQKPFKLYLYNGGKSLEARLQPGVDEMKTTLESMGYEENIDFYFVIDPEAEHNESAWAKWIPDFLMKLFKTN